ncbi:hypothetical protein AV530_010812 [Patagioenas fasciata monilis]|uniref:Secreted protein n=1 Tax=Patagioenas fasciata monilis TaxID=372326 RepID=A0A1V4K824_PATFA|nr:hypothetical protein AV530_010812 [Patagioenas fasciata monilis]
MTPLSAALLGVLQGSCLLAAEPGTHGGGHGRYLKRLPNAEQVWTMRQFFSCSETRCLWVNVEKSFV